MNQTIPAKAPGLLSTHSAAGSRVPRPRVKWVSRVAVPAFALAAVGGLLGWATRDAWLPARAVDVVSVMILPAGGASAQPSAAAAGAETAGPPSVPDPAPAAGDTRAGATAAPGPVVAQASGWIEPDPYPTYVSALAGGIIEAIHVLEGDEVSSGQAIATLVADDARLADEHAAASVATARAELEAAEARLAAARREWENPFDEVRAVETTAAELAETRSELARLDSRVRREQALLDELKVVRDLVAEGYEKGAATQLERANSRLRVEAQAAQLASTKELKPILAARVERLAAKLRAAREDRRLRIAEKRELDEARAAVSAAEAALARAGARRGETRLRLKRMQVVAPSPGRVMRLLKAPGDKLMVDGDQPRSAQVAGLYDPNSLQVRVDVPLADAAKVRPGQQATVVADILPDREFDGRVTRIVREADIQKNTLEVKVAIEQPDDLLTPEVLARVKFHAPAGEPGAPAADSTAERLYVPAGLVSGGPETGVVFVVDAAAGAARRREVSLGGRRGGWVQVREGLRPGDRLVAADPSGLTDGERVRVRGESRKYDRSE